MRSFASLRYLTPLLAFGVFWWLRPQTFNQILGREIVLNLGGGDSPRELTIPMWLLVVAPLALRVGLPLILRASLLLPYAATALTHGIARPTTFDPARDLPDNPAAPGSQDKAGVDQAIAAALAARNRQAAADFPTQRGTFANAEARSRLVAPLPSRPFGGRDAAR